MWISVIEKAWAKVKGSYFAAQGGRIENALRTLAGIPVENFRMSKIRSQSQAHQFWKKLKDADDRGYYMGAGTSGGQNDNNVCGIINMHAYTVIAIFKLDYTNSTSTTPQKMIVARNPWGRSEYKLEWSGSDPRWNDEKLRAQVPLGIDPR